MLYFFILMDNVAADVRCDECRNYYPFGIKQEKMIVMLGNLCSFNKRN